MSCSSCNKRDNQNPNTPNLMFAQSKTFGENISIHADYPLFEQTQDQYVLREIGKINANLWQIGKDMTKLGKDATYFGKEITALKSKPTGSGFTRQQVESILQDYYGDDINRIDKNHAEQESRITQAWNHRKNIEAKTDKIIIDQQDFHSKFDNLGIALQEAKEHRDSLESKFESHSHGNGKPTCEWYDISCQFNQGLKGMAIIGALGLGSYLVLKKL